MLNYLSSFFRSLKDIIQHENTRVVQYEIVSHAENYNESGETHVKVRRKYSRKKSIH